VGDKRPVPCLRRTALIWSARTTECFCPPHGDRGRRARLRYRPDEDRLSRSARNISRARCLGTSGCGTRLWRRAVLAGLRGGHRLPRSRSFERCASEGVSSLVRSWRRTASGLCASTSGEDLEKLGLVSDTLEISLVTTPWWFLPKHVLGRERGRTGGVGRLLRLAHPCSQHGDAADRYGVEPGTH